VEKPEFTIRSFLLHTKDVPHKYALAGDKPAHRVVLFSRQVVSEVSSVLLRGRGRRLPLPHSTHLGKQARSGRGGCSPLCFAPKPAEFSTAGSHQRLS
jgi:hypothetical protein